MKKDNTLEKITKAIESEIEAFGEVIDVSKFKELQKQLEKYLIRDALTLALNRWKFEEVLKREIKRSKDSGHPLFLLMLDIDNFKIMNDNFGHNYGHDVLRKIAWALEYIAEETIGKSHRFGRWGGEEFLYIFPSAKHKEAKEASNALMEKLEDDYMNHLLHCRVGVSVGIANLKKSDDHKTFIKRADKAMYRAKKHGNRVCISR